jgi:hypothetical protein
MLLPLPTPFAAGLGQRAEAARSRLLWDADFRTMPRQILPTTQAVWKALIAGSYAAAGAAPALSNAWIFDQTVFGSDVPDFVGGKTLTNVGDSIAQNRIMLGLLKGAPGQRWHPCSEWPDGGDTHYAAPLNTDFNPGAASWAMLIVLRHGAKPAANGVLVSKQQASNAGWRLERTTAGLYRFVIHDGAVAATLNIATPARDSAPHYIFVRINRTANELQAFTDMGAVASLNIAGMGAITSNVTMRVGGPTATHLVNTTVPWQCAWMGVLTGAAAEGVTSTHLGRFWTHAKKPAAVTTYARTGQIYTEIEDDPTLGVRVAGWQNNQCAWERDSSFPGYGLGASDHAGFTNLLSDSTMADWAWTDIDFITYTARAPNELTEASEAIATVNPNHGRMTLALTNGQNVQFSVYAGGASEGAQLQLSIYDATFTNLKIQVTHDLTQPWKRLTLGGGWVADATANFGFQVSFVDADQGCYLWGAQVRIGDYDGPLAFADGAPLSTNAPDIRVTGAAAAVLRAEEGEIVAEYSCAAAAQATDRFVVDVSNAASNVNRRAIKVTAAGVTTLMYDSGAVDRVGPVLAAGDQEKLQTQDKRAELAWAATRFLLPTYRARLRLPHDGELEAGGVAAALAYSDTVTTAWLGQDRANANPLNGVLRRVRCYGAAAP